MKIILNNIGKRFNTEWIFKGMSYEFESGNSYAVLGANGSGKSTLLQVIAGSMTVSEGDVKYESQDTGIKTYNLQLTTPDSIFQHLTIAAPYLELFEEHTLKEAIEFHSKFKKFFSNFSTENIIYLLGMKRSKDKQLKNFSSGMKQRVKLALAILSDVPILLLDEPCSNLDAEGVEWYQKLIKDHSKNRLIIVCSNQQKGEYGFCNKEIVIFTFSYQPSDRLLF